MSTITPRTMPGVLELLPAEQIAFNHLLDTIRRGYERFGFLPVETPAMEFVDILLTKSGGETEKQVYFAQSTGDRHYGRDPKLALRFDLTVPLARYVAEHEAALSFPFRRYQIQRVWRGEAAQKGRFREFYQCDIDVIGKDELALDHDAEIPAVIAGIFEALAIGDFTIGVNHRKVLTGFFASLGLDEPVKRRDVLREIDKIDKRGQDAVAATLAAEPLSLTEDQVRQIIDFITLKGTNEQIVEGLKALPVSDETFRLGVDELAYVVRRMAAFGIPEGRVKVNLSIARGLDYYTGMVYETLLNDHPELGSICSGGRYDDLAGYYTKSKLPGVGISIGASRLFDKLRELGLIKPATTTVDVLVTRFDETLADFYTRIASTLRSSGIATEQLLEPWKPKRQLKHANKVGVRFLVIAGDAEYARGAVALKDMLTGEQVEVAVDALAAEILRRQA